MIGNVLSCYYIVSPDVIGSDAMVEDNESSIAVMRAELESVKEQLSKVKAKKNKSKKDEKHKIMIQEAAIALSNLGIKKSHANSVVKNLCKERAYNSSEDLLKDAIVYIG
jgi:Holliday junction resolvasome RuvABC DNA-binding subunit